LDGSATFELPAIAEFYLRAVQSNHLRTNADLAGARVGTRCVIEPEDFSGARLMVTDDLHGVGIEVS